jgi:large subunit ribosomal protein L21
MEPYAVIETGGKQYRVQPGSKLKVERIESEIGAKLEIGPVLAVSDGTTLKIGQPAVEEAKVACTVLEHLRGPKLVSFKKKRRKGFAKKKGHRQELTALQVDSI